MPWTYWCLVLVVIIWTLSCWIYFRKHKKVIAFCIILQHWDGRCSWSYCTYYTPCFKEVDSGVYWFHLFRLWRKSCLFHIFKITQWIHFIFILLFKQLHQVCHIWIFGIFLKFVTLTLSCFDCYESIVWATMGWWGYSQSEGVVNVKVSFGRINLCLCCIFKILYW